jgi:aspartate ammonia-lyase
MVEQSIGLATALNPLLGYSVATSIAAEALAPGRGVAEIVRERGLMTQAELDLVLSPERLANLRPRVGDAEERAQVSKEQLLEEPQP